MALTLHQPWCGIVALGLKLVENRRWEPPPGLIGQRFAIHAGMKWDDASVEFIERTLGSRTPPESRLAGVLATAILADVATSAEECEAFEPGQGRWFMGPYGWLLTDIRRLAWPIGCRGMQKLWALPLRVENRLRDEGVL